MANLSHWDVATDFTAEQAAALIVGLDASQPGYNRAKTQPIYERMEACYRDRKRWRGQGGYTFPLDGDGLPQYVDELQRDEFALTESDAMLESIDLNLASKTAGYDDGEQLRRWFADEGRCGFDKQRFSRMELARWLSAIGVKSIYPFAGSQTTVQEMTVGHWPWGDYHTESLGHLEAAAKRFWMHYDPTDETYAPTNVTVSEWLQKECKVSRTMADSIASMLRPDGLPVGPRK